MTIRANASEESMRTCCNRRLRLAWLRLSRRRGIRGEHGATLLEFALVGILFMLLTAGMMELARGVWIYHSLAHAAREGARLAIVRGSDSGRTATEGDVRDYVRGRLPFGTVDVTTTWNPDKTPGSTVQVRVEYAFSPVVPFFPAVPLASTSKMVISF
jgi:Flp pilus assembly protein TadG